MSVQIIEYLDWSKSIIQVDWILPKRIKFLLQLKFYSQRSFENLFAWKRHRTQGTREERSCEAAYWRVLRTPRRARTESRSSGPEVVRSARVPSMGDLLCLFTGRPPSGRGGWQETTQRLCPHDTRVFWWDADAWGFCCDGCLRSKFLSAFTHGLVSRPTTLLTTLFGRVIRSGHNPRTQEVAKNSSRSVSFLWLQSVWAHHRPGATKPSLTLFKNNLSSSVFFLI